MLGVISVEMIRERQEQGTYLGWAASRYLDLLARGDRDVCAYCECVLSDSNRTIDHIQPKAQGGKNNLGNLCLCCMTCNRRKGDLPVGDFRRMLAGIPVARPAPRKKKAKLTQRLDLADWDEGHAAARAQADKAFTADHEAASRRAAGSAFHHAQMKRSGSDAVKGEVVRDGVRRNWKGLPDP